MMKYSRESVSRGAIVLAVASLLLGCVHATAATPSLAVKAERIYLGNGRVIANGTILIEDGHIKAIGRKVQAPEGTPVIRIQGATVTPGLIDANARIEPADLIPHGHESHDHESHDASEPAHEITVVEQEVVEEVSVEPTEHTAHASEDHDPLLHVCQDDLHVGDDDLEIPLISGVQATAVVNEQSSEVVPHIRVLDSIDLHGTDFQRLVRGGVTTVYASPDASAVIGARGAILHTAGPIDDRVITPAAAVKATIGSDPSSLGTYNRPPSRYSTMTIYARRPNSRMGLAWVFRKAFYDALRLGEGLPVYGADAAEPEALAELFGVLDGQTPLRIQARLQQDISAAIRLTEEFGLSFLLEEATEAYRCIDEIKASGAPVVFGPIYEQPGGIRVRSGEGRNSRYYTFSALLAAGIPTALSAQEFREEDGLARQAMYAQRFGVDFDAALASVTQTPAKLLGIDDRLGTLATGKQADLVIWSGTPFDATSTPVVVVIAGRVVVDRR